MAGSLVIPDEHLEIPDVLPVLPVRDLVVFPYMIVPLFVSRDLSVQAVDEALARDRLVWMSAQKDGSEDAPGPDGMFKMGTVGMVMRMRKLPDGRVKVLVQGLVKATLEEMIRDKPCYAAKISRIREIPMDVVDLETEALMRSVKENLEKLISIGKVLSPDVMLVLSGVADPGRLADLCAANLGLKVPEAQHILETLEPIKRLRAINDHLSKEVQVLAMQAKIQSQAKEEMSKTQREYFLRAQLRQIQHELGETDDKAEEVAELRERVLRAGLSEEALAEAKKQLRRLEQMHGDSAEAGVVRSYVDWLADLPWQKVSEDQLDLKRARAILDEDHFDLEKIKDRILEYLAVMKLKGATSKGAAVALKGPILCFVGPPGVGKTSLGRSIARSLGRAFTRMSLGGLHDEAEIRGHRRTYVGAMPGRVLQGLKAAKTKNPVFMLDEVDKLGADFRGDPSAALLEVLDPEQNHAFRDHYLNVDFDLSSVLFIATANSAEPIPPALRDRMEVIPLSGYTLEEKVAIARRHLLPKQLAENGLTAEQVVVEDGAIQRLVEGYTREAGLRNLERELASVLRKISRRLAEGEKPATTIVVKARDIALALGAPRHLPEDELGEPAIGLATGLAWTPYGGEVLHIEASAMRGKGGLILTGQLGDVMKESAQAALTVCRARAEELGIASDYFQQHELHVHVPAGAMPKDGPSAGVSLATALVSLVTGQAVRSDVAMTGEITLRGRVLPVGGLKEKLLAALRAGLRTVAIPAQNEKDLAEIPENVRRGLKLVLARTLDDVLEVALVAGKRSRRIRLASGAAGKRR